MYLPYLYGRRFELLAVRMMLKDERDRSGLLPLIEPLMSNCSEIRRCIEHCSDMSQPLALVINPDKHQLKTAAAQQAWLLEMSQAVASTPTVIPTFVCRVDDAPTAVGNFLALYSDREVAVVYPGKRLTGADVKWLSRQRSIRWHIVAADKVPQARWQEFPIDKLILLQDYFVKKERNADYSGQEFFTDRHHGVPSNAAGVGDHLCVGSQFKNGGSTPHAVAIHAAYVEPEDRDVWIEHFVSSDITKDEGDVASKFVDAARKLTRAVRSRPREFGDNRALREFTRMARTADYQGLGISKQLQMVHHMCLMMDVLEGRL